MTIHQDFLLSTKLLKRHLRAVFYGVVGAAMLVSFIVFMAAFQLPIYLYRLTIIKLVAPFYRPQICKAVTVGAQFQATEFLEANLNACETFRYWIVGKNMYNGDISLEKLQKLILDRWVNVRKNNGLELCYPELQQHIEYWMGFMFWKRDSNFDLSNHIIYHELDNCATTDHSERYVNQLMENLLSRPSPPEQSPWEVHLIRHYKSDEFGDSPKQTVLLFRFHHAMADGFSMVHLVLEALLGGKRERALIPVPNKSGTNHFAAQLANALVSPIRFLTDFGFMMRLFWLRKSPWKPRNRVSNGLKENFNSHIYRKSPLIRLEKLKYIKNSFGVNLSSVILSCLSAAIMKSTNTGAWENIKASMPLPTRGHANKLRNLTLPTIIQLDTRQHLSPKERLLEMNKSFHHAKHSFMPPILWSISKILSGSLAKTFAGVPNWRNIRVCISNFPGPQTEAVLDSGELQVVGFDAALGAFTDLVFMTTSYLGNIRIHLTADSGVMDGSKVEKIIKDFGEELNTLHQLASEHEIIESKVV